MGNKNCCGPQVENPNSTESAFNKKQTKKGDNRNRKSESNEQDSSKRHASVSPMRDNQFEEQHNQTASQRDQRHKRTKSSNSSTTQTRNNSTNNSGLHTRNNSFVDEIYAQQKEAEMTFTSSDNERKSFQTKTSHSRVDSVASNQTFDQFNGNNNKAFNYTITQNENKIQTDGQTTRQNLEQSFTDSRAQSISNIFDKILDPKREKPFIIIFKNKNENDVSFSKNNTNVSDNKLQESQRNKTQSPSDSSEFKNQFSNLISNEYFEQPQQSQKNENKKSSQQVLLGGNGINTKTKVGEQVIEQSKHQLFKQNFSGIFQQSQSQVSNLANSQKHFMSENSILADSVKHFMTEESLDITQNPLEQSIVNIDNNIEPELKKKNEISPAVIFEYQPPNDDQLEFEEIFEDETGDSDTENILSDLTMILRQGDKRQVEKKLYEYIVKKVNTFGGIRKKDNEFKMKRRQLINIEDADAVLTDEYFMICTRYIPLLETIRQSNYYIFEDHFQNLLQQEQVHKRLLQKLQNLSLEQISKNVDYERLCNEGIFSRQTGYPEQLSQLSLEELEKIKDHCNDQVMRQYKVNKNEKWTKRVKSIQLYQVFQCFSEDQIHFFEGFEYALVERRIRSLQSDIGQSNLWSDSQLSSSRISNSSKHSETSILMKQYLQQKKIDQEEKNQLDQQIQKQTAEMLIANQQIEHKFQKDFIENNRATLGVQSSLKKVGFMNTNFKPNLTNFQDNQDQIKNGESLLDQLNDIESYLITPTNLKSFKDSDQKPQVFTFDQDSLEQSQLELYEEQSLLSERGVILEEKYLKTIEESDNQKINQYDNNRNCETNDSMLSGQQKTPTSQNESFVDESKIEAQIIVKQKQLTRSIFTIAEESNSQSMYASSIYKCQDSLKGSITQ